MDLVKIINLNSLVISGGGMKGFLYIGTIKLLFEYNIINKFKYFYGTSFGGIIVTCLNLGWSLQELLKLAIEFPLNEIIEFDFDNILNNNGIIPQTNYETFYKKIVSFKHFSEDITFKELFDSTRKELHLYAYSFKQSTVVDFNYVTYPNCKIWQALYMTTALPLIIPPFTFNDDLFIDGGVMENFPIDRVHQENKPYTIGISTDTYKINIEETNKIFVEKNIQKYLSYIIDLFQIISTKEINNLHKNTFVLNFDEQTTIENLKSFDFTINSNIKKQLIESGYKQAAVQFNNIIEYLFHTQLLINKKKLKYNIT